MARFNTSPAPAAQSNSIDEARKAVLYVNISLPYKKPDGTVGKYPLGRTGLVITGVGSDAKLVEMHKADPEAFQKMLAQHMIVEVRSAEPSAPVTFAF